MTDEEVRNIARTAAREAVHQMMLAIGVNASDPAAMIDMQRDFRSLREWRESMQSIRRHSLLTAVGVIVVGILGILYLSLTGRP